MVADGNEQHFIDAVVDFEIDGSSAGVLKGIAGNFGDGGRDASLRLHIKFERSGDASGALPCQHDVVLVSDLHREQLKLHWEPASARFLATRTVTSSRSRKKSRYKMPAISP